MLPTCSLRTRIRKKRSTIPYFWIAQIYCIFYSMWKWNRKNASKQFQSHESAKRMKWGFELNNTACIGFLLSLLVRCTAWHRIRYDASLMTFIKREEIERRKKNNLRIVAKNGPTNFTTISFFPDWQYAWINLINTHHRYNPIRSDQDNDNLLITPILTFYLRKYTCDRQGRYYLLFCNKSFLNYFLFFSWHSSVFCFLFHLVTFLVKNLIYKS